MLDLAHAAEHLGAAAQAVFDPGTAAASGWLGVQAHALRRGGAVGKDTVLTAPGALAATPGLASDHPRRRSVFPRPRATS